MSWRSTRNGDYPAEGAKVVAYNGEEAWVSRYSAGEFRSTEHGFEIAPTTHWAPLPEDALPKREVSFSASDHYTLFRGIRLEGRDLEPKRDGNEVYYRPILSYRGKGFVSACLQWFDEDDYDQDRFLNTQQYGCEEDCDRVCEAANLLLGDMHQSIAIKRLYPLLKDRLRELGVLREEDDTDASE